MGLFDKFKKNSKNVKKENEKINTSSGNLFDEKPKDALTNNMNFDEKLGTYVIEIKGIIFESGTEQGDTYISSLDKIADNYYNAFRQDMGQTRRSDSGRRTYTIIYRPLILPRGYQPAGI